MSSKSDRAPWFTDDDRAFAVLAGAIGAGLILASLAGWYASEKSTPKVLPAAMLVVGVITAMVAAANEVLGRKHVRMRLTRLRSLRGYLILEYRDAVRLAENADLSDAVRDGQIMRARTLYAALRESYTTFGDEVPEVDPPIERIGA